jgi:hypothetical protein
LELHAGMTWDSRRVHALDEIDFLGGYVLFIQNDGIGSLRFLEMLEKFYIHYVLEQVKKERLRFPSGTNAEMEAVLPFPIFIAFLNLLAAVLNLSSSSLGS